MAVYYNEFDPFAAAWLRELIAEGLIAEGEVDGRSILEVRPADLAGFDQCHFFAGIGVWSLALRRAGWDDTREAWTGSCPCQPLSGAGQRKGHADERHLWPAFHALISECRPAIVFGEQVAGKDGREWLAAVRADMEASRYACGAADLCAAGVGAPHIRQRLFWVAQRLAHADDAGLEGRRGVPGGAGECAAGPLGMAGRLADADGGECGRIADGEGRQRDGTPAGWQQGDGEPQSGGAAGGLANAGRRQLRDGRSGNLAEASGDDQIAEKEWQRLRPNVGHDCARGWPGAHDGLWQAADWLFCRDGKWRPVRPGTFPLADAGAYRNRVGLLRGAGNAINVAVAQVFIESVMDLAA